MKVIYNKFKWRRGKEIVYAEELHMKKNDYYQNVDKVTSWEKNEKENYRQAFIAIDANDHCNYDKVKSYYLSEVIQNHQDIILGAELEGDWEEIEKEIEQLLLLREII